MLLHGCKLSIPVLNTPPTPTSPTFPSCFRSYEVWEERSEKQCPRTSRFGPGRGGKYLQQQLHTDRCKLSSEIRSLDLQSTGLDIKNFQKTQPTSQVAFISIARHVHTARSTAVARTPFIEELEFHSWMWLPVGRKWDRKTAPRSPARVRARPQSDIGTLRLMSARPMDKRSLQGQLASSVEGGRELVECGRMRDVGLVWVEAVITMNRVTSRGLRWAVTNA